MPSHARLPRRGDKSNVQQPETGRELAFDLYGDQHRAARAAALELLAQHSPADEKEVRDKGRILSLIAAQPNIFSRNCEVGHITASAVIVELESHRTLLHYHKRLGRWLQVGGHLEQETDIAQAALREAREESGLPDLRFYPSDSSAAPIDIDVHTIPESGGQREHLHLDFRYVLVTRQPDALAPAPGESRRFRWLSFADALDRDDEIDAALRRLLRKARDLFSSNVR